MTMIYTRAAKLSTITSDYEYWINTDHITYVGSKVKSTTGCLIHVLGRDTPIDTNESIDDIMNKIRNAS